MKYLFFSIVLFCITVVAVVLSIIADYESSGCTLAKLWELLSLCTALSTVLSLLCWLNKQTQELREEFSTKQIQERSKRRN